MKRAVLVVDAEPYWRPTIARLLRGCDYRAAAEGLKAALLAFRAVMADIAARAQAGQTRGANLERELMAAGQARNREIARILQDGRFAVSSDEARKALMLLMTEPMPSAAPAAAALMRRLTERRPLARKSAPRAKSP